MARTKRVRYTTPGDLIISGLLLSVLGGFLGYAAPALLVIAGLGGTILTVGVVGMGVRLGIEDAERRKNQV